jgi:hypothetical protein
MWHGPGGGRRLATSHVYADDAGWRPSLRSSTTGRAALHATTRTSAHLPWSTADSSASGSGDMVVTPRVTILLITS